MFYVRYLAVCDAGGKQFSDEYPAGDAPVGR
jgi:hypothetical protein